MDPIRNKPPLRGASAKLGRGPAAAPSTRRISNGVGVFSLNPKYRSEEKRLATSLKKAATLLKKAKNSLDVYLVPDSLIRLLNRKYRKINKITDVLAFSFGSFPHPVSFRKPLGEIYLAPDYIRRRGGNVGRLALHGFLHLLGYTHNKKGDRMRMEKLEKKLIGLLVRRLNSSTNR